jgi:DNA-directed RNA polymerase beta subunit
LDKVAGQARKDARDAARTQLLKSLGVESEEALQKALKEADDLRKSQMSEQDRIKAEHADMQRKLQDAETQRQQAEAQRQQALIKAEVVAKAAGRFADPNAVVKLLDMGKVKFDGEQVTGVQEALDELAKASPWALLPTKPVVPTIGPTNPAAPGTPAKTNDDELRQIFYGGPKRSSIFG